ncbi:hypothetical protein SNE40_008352 [Patella caerulea]|uniref:C2H2-type domain-containing protein n=1 Tax=Patella caerulea TaxID=87958 RepID=A0AAN8QAA6_PATCE
MAEDKEIQSTEEPVGLNLSAVARLLMTSSTTVRTTDGEDEERDENRPNSPPPPVTSATPPLTNVITAASTSTATVTSIPDEAPDRLHDGLASDAETDIVVDDCQSPTDLTILQSDLSPDSYEYTPLGYTTSGGYYKCRFCSFMTMTYTHLQLHMPKHGGHKALKCPMCDYTTNDKSNFRRHKRLHNRSNPATVLRCGKCEFTTVLPRKIREHYCHEHNEDYGPIMPQIATSASIVIPTYQENHFNGSRHIDIAQGHCSSTGLGQGHCTVTGVSVGSSGIHSLLTSGQGPSVQFARANPIMPNCVNQYSYDSPSHRVHEDRTIASDYLRSIVSNIIPTPRVPATSTITSSSFYLPHAVESSQDMSPTGQKAVSSNRSYQIEEDDQQKIKFKSEPFDSDDVSDVSSSAIPLVIHSREIPRPMEAQTTQRLSIDIYDGNIYQEHSNEETSSSNQMYTENMRRKYPRGSNMSHNISIKCETSHVGVQCSLPVVKRETVETEGRRGDRNTNTVLYNRGVQCELLTPRRGTNSRSTSEPGGSESQTSDTRCSHCGISFDDEVLFSIHIGCHSHTDPFVCNVCGKQCSNKYGFYSHIMRGHQC